MNGDSLESRHNHELENFVKHVNFYKQNNKLFKNKKKPWLKKNLTFFFDYRDPKMPRNDIINLLYVQQTIHFQTFVEFHELPSHKNNFKSEIKVTPQ